MKTLGKLAVRTVLLLFVIVFCTACPYESKYPLTGEAVEYNPHFLGTFKKESDVLTITAKNKKFVNFKYVDGLDESEITGVGYITIINNITFAVLEKRETGMFLIYKVASVNQSGITVMELDDEGKIEDENFKNPQAFEKFVLKNPDAFSDRLRWVRK